MGEDDWISDLCSVTSEPGRCELVRKSKIQLSKTHIYIYTSILALEGNHGANNILVDTLLF